MPNKKYERGRAFEYAVKKKLEERGWTVIRAAGSHGWADLVAWKEGTPTLIIQCKKYSAKDTELKEYKKMLPLREYIGWNTPRIYVFVDRPKRGVRRWRWLTPDGTWDEIEEDRLLNTTT